MYRYIHTVTGQVVEVPCRVQGGSWEPLPKPPEPKPKTPKPSVPNSGTTPKGEKHG